MPALRPSLEPFGAGAMGGGEGEGGEGGLGCRFRDVVARWWVWFGPRKGLAGRGWLIMAGHGWPWLAKADLEWPWLA